MAVNIVVVPACFPSEENRLSGQFIWDQCAALVRRGHRVTVLHAHPVNYKRWFSGRLGKLWYGIKDGMRIYSMDYPAFATGRFPRLASFCYGMVLRCLWKKFKTENGRPDVLHAHFTTFAGYRSAALAQESGTPLVVTEHYSLFLEERLNPAVKRMLMKTLEESDEFICVSDSLKKKIQEHAGAQTKIAVVPNMVDPVFTFHQPAKTTPFRFFSAGNLIPLKKMDVLIAAFASAFPDDPDTVLEIAGGGEQFRLLERLIREHRMQRRIFLCGAADRRQMLEKMAECHAFVMVSEKETFGIVYREAMAVGRPIIAARNGGAEENWDDSQGMLVPPNDVEATARALKRMRDTADKYDAEAISGRCLAHYSADSVAARLEAIYRKAGHPRPE